MSAAGTSAGSVLPLVKRARQSEIHGGDSGPAVLSLRAVTDSAVTK